MCVWIVNISLNMDMMDNTMENTSNIQQIENNQQRLVSNRSGAPYILSLNAANWTGGLLTSVHKLWKENVLCDTNIKCLNNETVTAHSLVLSASSPLLKDFFSKVSLTCYILPL